MEQHRRPTPEVIDAIIRTRDIQSVAEMMSKGVDVLHPLLTKLASTNEDLFLWFVDELAKIYFSGFDIVNTANAVYSEASLIAIDSRSLRLVSGLLGRYNPNPESVVQDLTSVLEYLPTINHIPIPPDQKTYDLAQYLINVILMNNIRTSAQLVSLFARLLNNSQHNIDTATAAGQMDMVAAWMTMRHFIDDLGNKLVNQGG